MNLRNEISGDQKMLLYRLGGIHIHDRRLFLFDYGDKKVKEYSIETGRLVQIYGNGYGDAPGEMMNPISLEVDDSGRVHILDSTSGRITVFHEDGSVIDIVNPREVFQGMSQGIWRMTMDDRGSEYVLLALDGKNPLFRYRKDGIVEHIGDFIGGAPTEQSLLVDGWISTYSSWLVYTPTYYPVIVLHNETLSRTEIVRTPHPNESHYRNVEIPDHITIIPPRDNMVNGYNQVDGDLYYVYNMLSKDDASPVIIDVYDLSSKSYSHSYELPYSDRMITQMTGSYVVSIADTVAYVYDYNESVQ